VTGPEQHAATVRDAVWKAPGHVHDAALAALDELVALARDNVGLRFLVDAKQALFEGASARAEAAEAALRTVAAQPHAPADGAGTDGAVHLYVQGHPMGCPICEAIEKGLA